MAKKSLRAQIPSLLVDRDFLKKLGAVIEREIREREEQEKVANKAPPWVSVTYTLSTSQHESLTFDRMQEILDTDLLPTSIVSFSARVYHHDKRFVDASMTIREPGLLDRPLESYEISSNDEPKLLKINEDLQKLFKNASQGYHATFRRGPYPRALSNLVVAIIAFCGAYLVFKALPAGGDKEKLAAALQLSVWVAMAIFLFAAGLLRWAYPTYEIVLGSSDTVRQQARFVIWGLFASVVLGTISKYAVALFGI